MKFCKSDDSSYGEVIFFVDPPTKNVICSIDGEDNHNLFSYEGIRDGLLAHPVHVSHFDIWFNSNYDPTVIKGFLKLQSASIETFKDKEEEISVKYYSWMKQAITGLISKDSKTIGLSGSSIGKSDVQNVCNFFLKNALANNDTELLVNGHSLGTIQSIFGEENPKMIITAQETDAAILQLVEQYKNGDPETQRNAGDELISRYDKQLRGLLNQAVRQNNGKVNLEDHDYLDKLQNLYTYFLERMKQFDPTKAKITTFIQSNIALIIKNMFNSNRSKIDKHTQTVGPSASNDGGEAAEDLTFSDPANMTRYKDNNSDEETFENKEFVNNIMENSLDPRLYNILKKYYYDKKTLEQIGQEEGVSFERVRQLINMALEKLRNNPEVKQLSPQAYKKIEALKVQMIFKEPNE